MGPVACAAMRLRLGSVEHDLTTRALVMGALAPVAAAGSPFDAVAGQAEQLVGDGADLLDVGGVQGLPGRQVGEEEELGRLVPVVAAVRARVGVPLSVDTWRARVLEECCAAGAVVGNDVTGFADPAYLGTAARLGMTVVATHTRLQPADGDLVAQVRCFLADRVARARAAGILDERIIVDAGLDLGKLPAQSLTLLQESAALADLGSALLLGATNTRFLGLLLGLEADERRVAVHAVSALGIARGCRIVRTSDVRAATRVAAVLDALLSARLGRVMAGAGGSDG